MLLKQLEKNRREVENENKGIDSELPIEVLPRVSVCIFFLEFDIKSSLALAFSPYHRQIYGIWSQMVFLLFFY